MAFLLSQICLMLFLQQTPVLHEPYSDDEAMSRDPGTDPSTDDGTNGGGSQDGPGGDNPSAAEGIDPSAPGNELDPRALAELQKALSQAMASPSLQMDPKTDSFTPPDNFSQSVFTPSIFPNERVWVLNTVKIMKNGRVEAVPGPISVESVPVSGSPPADRYVFFWAEYQLGAPGRSSILPTPAPEFLVTEVPAGAHLLRNAADMMYFKPGRWRQSTLKIRIAAPRTYFRTPAFDDVALPVPRQFDGSVQIRNMSNRVFGRPDRRFLMKMIQYFRQFDVLPLLPYGNRISLEEAILMQKRGVCRHRALLFFAIAQSWGYDVRLVMNMVHAFVEVRQSGHSWVRVDLGGAVLPRGFTPPSGPGLFTPVTYRYQLTGSTVVRAGEDLSVEVIHRDHPPAFLWAILSDSRGREVARNPVFPKKSTIESLRVPVPVGLPAGRYRVVLKPEGPL
ncbi:hypothetical protein KKD52_01895 [Myxococcota bacterium]|nr:hypothetical protein [Myxococcota bacterium]MBU1411590.1 hypothetical protein [Myxococcota bacterium]MBU1509086.1 hypothetical protein [Myxococcota bacterium]